MKLCMVGTGYVGLVSGVCFSDLGNDVVCVDKDKDKIEKCLWKFVKESKNPVAYASMTKTICPICEKEMGDHTISQTRECVKQFIIDVENLEL